MQVPGSDNAGPGSDILGLELMSEGIEICLKKKKANGIMFGCNFNLSEIFISEWTLSLSGSCLLINLNESSNWRFFIDEAGAGIWCGLVFILGGILNTVTAKYRIHQLIITNLVYGIITSLFALALVILSIIQVTQSFPFRIIQSEEYKKSYGFNILQIFIGLTEVILGIMTSILSCSATCCRKSGNTTSLRSEVMYSQAGGLDQAQIISLANQMQERRNIAANEERLQPPRYNDVATPSCPSQC